MKNSVVIFLNCLLITACSDFKALSFSSSNPSTQNSEFTFDKLSAGQDLVIPEGEYTYDAILNGELKITRPIKITGAGKNKTKLKFRINRDQASIRIVTSNVEIKNLEIEAHLVESLSGDGISGGRGEFGTGITLGYYYQNYEHPEVKNIVLDNLAISRPDEGFVATAITIIGRVSQARISNIDVLNKTSKLMILHWGGYTTLQENIPAPYTLDQPGYGLVESYHPHDISIENIFYERAASLFAISSSYNIDINGAQGGTSSEVLFMLPGDEINDMAVPEDKSLIGSNISFQNIETDLISKVDTNAHVIRISSVGSSILKKDSLGNRPKQVLPYKNLLLKNIKINSVTNTSDAKGTRNFRFGINAHDLTGENIRFDNIDLNEVGKNTQTYDSMNADSYGIYLRNAEGLNSTQIVFNNIKSSAKRGIGLIDSANVDILNSVFNRKGLVLESGESAGIYYQQPNDEYAKDIQNINIKNVSFGDYSFVARYPLNSPSTFCDRVNYDNIVLIMPFTGILERDNSCL